MTQEYYFKEGCFIEEWHNSANDELMSVARVRVEVGKSTKLHALKNTHERYVMLEGVAEVTVDKKSWQVGPGDVVVIEPEVPQKIANKGLTDLRFLALCNPRFKEANYLELEE